MDLDFNYLFTWIWICNSRWISTMDLDFIFYGFICSHRLDFIFDTKFSMNLDLDWYDWTEIMITQSMRTVNCMIVFTCSDKFGTTKGR